MVIQYSGKAKKQLAKIARGDRPRAKRIVQAIHGYAAEPGADCDVKVLQAHEERVSRLRVGNYRVFFTEDGRVMQIVRIGHRQGVHDV